MGTSLSIVQDSGGKRVIIDESRKSKMRMGGGHIGK